MHYPSSFADSLQLKLSLNEDSPEVAAHGPI